MLLTLIIALLAIVNEKNRKYLQLKLSYTDYILFAINFILINYFVFYNSFFTRGIIIKWLFFEDFGFNNPLVLVCNEDYTAQRLQRVFMPQFGVDSLRSALP